MVLETGCELPKAARQYGVKPEAVRSILRKRARFYKETPGLERAYGKLGRLFESSPYEYGSAQAMADALELSLRTIRKWLWWSGQAKDAMLFWRRARRERRRQELLEEYRNACLAAGKPLWKNNPAHRFSTRAGRQMLYKYFPSWVHFQSEAQLPRWMWDQYISPMYLDAEHALTRRLADITRLPRAYRPNSRWTPLVELAQRWLPPDHQLQPALARYQSDRKAYRLANVQAKAERRRRRALDGPDAQGLGLVHRFRGLGADAARAYARERSAGGAESPSTGSVRDGMESQTGEDDRS